MDPSSSHDYATPLYGRRRMNLNGDNLSQQDYAQRIKAKQYQADLMQQIADKQARLAKVRLQDDQFAPSRQRRVCFSELPPPDAAADVYVTQSHQSYPSSPARLNVTLASQIPPALRQAETSKPAALPPDNHSPPRLSAAVLPSPSPANPKVESKHQAPSVNNYNSSRNKNKQALDRRPRPVQPKNPSSTKPMSQLQLPHINPRTWIRLAQIAHRLSHDGATQSVSTSIFPYNDHDRIHPDDAIRKQTLEALNRLEAMLLEEDTRVLTSS
ncbi:hypothetical protein SeMB42_g03926 [Synchytrium endobioticum]|uniref:Uncharacterized protein n=1 Tax=Synchytrium endobioticum TaxID=286115 RepID=A0A507CX56_9FUNG|nr:hypothetical protein SeLEV6574_g04947 [Synchytrium endobioticum]TPX45650.1 hypothetical protein SeMB42_g03926 [Synchytrium endobioticum]